MVLEAHPVEWMLSGFGDEIDPDPEVQLSVLQALGARHIEVRSAWGEGVLSLSEERLDILARLLAERTMGVSAIASPVGKVPYTVSTESELARLRGAIRVAQRLEAKYIRLFSFWPDGFSYNPSAPLNIGPLDDDVAGGMRARVMEHLAAMAEVAGTEGIVLILENEKDVYADTPARMHDIMTTVASPHLRVAWDPANYVQAGVRPFNDGWSLLGEFVEYLHVKDARTADGVVTPAGDADGQLAETISAMVARGYCGYASLEPHLRVSGGRGSLSGPGSFGRAARAFQTLATAQGVKLV